MQRWNRIVFIFSVLLAPLLLVCFAGSSMLYFALAIFLHECAHLLALLLFRGHIRSFLPAPFGLCIVYEENSLSPRAEIAVTVAGCVVNIVTGGTAMLCYRLWQWNILLFAIVNIVIGTVNLLPMYPLDGGRLLHLLVNARFGPDTAWHVSQAVTYCFGFLLFLLSSYFLLTGQAGVYPLLFSVYIFAGNAKRAEKI